MSYSSDYLAEAARVLDGLDAGRIEALVQALKRLKADGGRVFFLGVGGSAANASHAVGDFRKICAIESYAPTDNAAELTARVNDEGWEASFSAWLDGSRLGAKDAVFILSVGGGDEGKNVSANIVAALRTAKARGAKIFGIVGRDGGATARAADLCLLVPTVNPRNVTPHAESFQSVLWHLIATHPDLKERPMKWEE